MKRETEREGGESQRETQTDKDTFRGNERDRVREREGGGRKGDRESGGGMEGERDRHG